MIYSIGSRSFRKFLRQRTEKTRPWKWYRFWDKLAQRLLPGKTDSRRTFLQVFLLKVWINLFEYILRRRLKQMELGFRKAFSYKESRKIYRGIMQGILRLHRISIPFLATDSSLGYVASECSDTYIKILMHLISCNTGLREETITVPIESALTFEARPGALSYQSLDYRAFLLEGAMKAAPSYLLSKPLNSNICWTCSRFSKCKHCPRCRVVRYCSEVCQKADWAEHRSACASIKEFVLETNYGRKLYTCLKQIRVRTQFTTAMF